AEHISGPCIKVLFCSKETPINHYLIPQRASFLATSSQNRRGSTSAVYESMYRGYVLRKLEDQSRKQQVS
ncbi:MAG: hypothetical protein M3243_02765, partial [Thermoproteota archaeon]|nr:hypothetical protein [Thermoproteota archaeon]